VNHGARLRSIAAAGAIAALVAGCGGNDGARHAGAGTPEPTPTSDARPPLVVVGDSLAAGRFADTQAEAFPQLLARATRSRLEVLGVTGATTAQLAAQPAPGGGKVVVLEAGTNDFLFQTPRRRFAEDYRALLDKVTAASPGAKLVCLTTWVPKDAADQPQAKIPPSSYDAAIRSACSAGAVANLSPLLDARGPAGRPTFLGPGDDFHPNSSGHAAIARLIESKLR
jgi:lysophospholipase L1-like esterase